MTAPLLPRDVVVSPLCTLVGTLGRLELESVAAALVLYLQAHSPDDWAPVTRRQIADWMRQSPQVNKMASNPFWRLDVHGFIVGGWIAGWDAPGRESADHPGTVTEKFLRAIGGWQVSRPVVLVESPYAGHPDALRYLACCLLDSVLRGESPMASHAVAPLALPEHCEAYGGLTGREIGLECRDALAALPGVSCVRYTDLGITPGMIRGGVWLAARNLDGEALRIWDRGEWPTPARLTHNHDVRAIGGGK